MSTDDREPVRTDEIAAFARRLRDLSRGIAADSATTAEYESFLADRDALLARVTQDQHDQKTNTQDDVAESPGRGPLSTPVPDDKLVQGWIELPGGLPPDEDELEERRHQLARWHDHATAGVHEDGDDAGWSR